MTALITSYALDKDSIFIYEQKTHSVPYNSVLVSPPTYVEGYVSVWETELSPVSDVSFGEEGTGDWVSKEDHRKDDLYTTEGKYEIGKEWEGNTYNGIGEIPSWLSLTPPPEEEPEPYVPSRVTRRQGRLALLSVGKLAEVEGMIASIEDPVKAMEAQVEYEADTWERGNEFLQSMWMALGGSEEELDDLFILASTK